MLHTTNRLALQVHLKANSMEKDGCLIWCGALAGYSYGVVYWQGKALGTHRASYMLAHDLDVGDLKGKVIRHMCDNPACIKPTHLVIGTQRDNMGDRVGKKLGKKGKHLTDAARAEAVACLAAGWTQKDVASSFGVTMLTLRKWKRRAYIEELTCRS